MPLYPRSSLSQACSDKRTWAKAQLLLVGAILAPRRRTITSALRVMGLSDEAGFAKYHHVLNRALWSSLQMSRVLLVLLIEHLTQDDEPPVFGIDETLERRRGSRISAKGVFRDAVCSSESHVGTAHSYCAGSSRELPSEGGTTAQEDHRLGTPDDYPTAPLAARSTHSRRD